jgi:hypothetical protein
MNVENIIGLLTMMFTLVLLFEGGIGCDAWRYDREDQTERWADWWPRQEDALDYDNRAAELRKMLEEYERIVGHA